MRYSTAHNPVKFINRSLIRADKNRHNEEDWHCEYRFSSIGFTNRYKSINFCWLYEFYLLVFADRFSSNGHDGVETVLLVVSKFQWNDLCDWDDPKTKPKYPRLAYKESISSSCRRTLSGILFNTIPSSNTYHNIAHCWDHELVRKGRGSPFLQIKQIVRWWISRNAYIFFRPKKRRYLTYDPAMVTKRLVYVKGLHVVKFGNNWMKKIPRTAKIGRGRRPSPIWLSEESFEFNYFQIGQACSPLTY